MIPVGHSLEREVKRRATPDKNRDRYDRKNRLFNACWFFHPYCHNTGYDPKAYIEALLAEFDISITYEQVRQQYEEDVTKGIQLRAVPSKEE